MGNFKGNFKLNLLSYVYPTLEKFSKPVDCVIYFKYSISPNINSI